MVKIIQKPIIKWFDSIAEASDCYIPPNYQVIDDNIILFEGSYEECEKYRKSIDIADI